MTTIVNKFNTFAAAAQHAAQNGVKTVQKGPVRIAPGSPS